MPFSLRLKYIIAALLFLLAGILSLIAGELFLIVIPFLAILIVPFYQLLVFKTEWIFYGLFLLLPLSTEFNFTPSLGVDFPDEFLMMLLTAIFVIKLIYKPSLLSREFVNHPLMILLLLHLLWILVATIFSQNEFLSLKFLLAKTWFIIPFVVLPYYFISDKKRLKLISILLLIAMSFVVCQALIRHAFFGFSFESVKDIYWPFFRNHVNFSGMLVCLLVVLFSFYKLTPNNSKYKKLLLTALVLYLAGVVLAYSRGAWLALIFGIAASWLIRKKMIGWAIGIACIIVVTVLLWLMIENRYLDFSHDYNTTIFHEDFQDHMQATVQFKDVSNAERFYRWIAGFNMIAEKPVVGFGPNNFYDHYKSYTETPFKTWVSNNPEHSSVHNYFILTATEQGLPGLVIFCALYFAMILRSQKLYHTISDAFYKQVALTVGVILVMIGVLIFMSDLIETDKIGSLFWLCLGMLIVLEKKKLNKNSVA